MGCPRVSVGCPAVSVGPSSLCSTGARFQGGSLYRESGRRSTGYHWNTAHGQRRYLRCTLTSGAEDRVLKVHLDIPRWVIEELDEHAEAFFDYDNRTHLIRMILVDWVNDNRDELRQAQETAEEDDEEDEEE